jgi:Helix-turn-helix domain
MSTFCPPMTRREKVFGAGRPLPLDRNAKHRIMAKARALSRRMVKGKAYGAITAKALDVLEALLWKFHNAKSGLCFPSHEKIAEAAGCCEATVKTAVNALEAAGLLSWVNRIKRVRETVAGLFGETVGRVRVIRTSNAYRFVDPKPTRSPETPIIPSKANFQLGTSNQDLFSSINEPERSPSPLETALARLGAAIQGKGLVVT